MVLYVHKFLQAMPQGTILYNTRKDDFMENNTQTKTSHKKFWIIGIVAVLAAVFAVSCSATDKSREANSPTAAPYVTEADAEQTESPAEQTAASTEQAAVSASGAEETENKAVSGIIDNYAISILDASTTTDYEGKPAIIINFDYQNNSNNNAMFAASVLCQAYQDGVSLSPAIIINGQYDSESSIKSLQPGAELKVQSAYTLTNTESPVTVEIIPIINLSGQKLTKTFAF